MYRQLVVICSSGFLVSLTAVGCSDSAGSGKQQTQECSSGHTLTESGGCIRGRTTTPEDTGASNDGEGDRDSSPQSGCAGGCPEDKYCNNGECIVGQSCEPGEVLGCSGDGKQRICTDKGVGFRKEPCPADKPNCRNGTCTETVCEPDTKYCKGDGITLMQCSDDGMSRDVVNTCRARCQDARCVSGCGGNAKGSYIGCGFQAVDLDNFDKGSDDANAKQYAVTASNTTEETVSVEVTDSSDATVATQDVPADELRVIKLPENNVKNTVLTDRSYNITASGPITVHQFNPINEPGTATNDASLLLPSNVLGTAYTVVGWPSNVSPQQAGARTFRPYATIVAANPGTTSVTVDSPARIVAGDGVRAISADSSREFTLTQGQVLQLTAKQERGNDITGMTIDADQAIAVFSGHECAHVNLDSQFCDHIEQQLFPNSSLGKKYVLSKFSPRGQEDDIYRMVASEDETTIHTTPQLGDLHGTTLNAGEVKEFKFRGNLAIEASKPIAVGQFMVGAGYPGRNNGCDLNYGLTSGCKVTTKCDDPDKSTRIGDPAFMLNVGTSQFLEEYVVQTPKGYQEDWFNVIAPHGADIQIDGTSLTSNGKEISGTPWRVHQIAVSPGVHRITSSGGKKFGLYVYGYDCDVSYAYPGGLK